LPVPLLLSLGWQPVPLPAVAFRAAAAPRMAAPVEEKQSLGQKLNRWVVDTNTANKMKSVRSGQKVKVRGRKLPAEVKEVIANKFKKEYPQKDLEALWGTLVQCYGTEALAAQAVKDNWQMINPSYSFPNTMLTSRDVLVDMMGKEEALEVMTLNPAVLQCGPSLDTLGPDEIKGFAQIRNIGTKIPDNLAVPLIAFTIALVAFPIAAVRVPGLEDSPLLNIVKPLCGILFAGAIEGSRIAIVGTIVKAKMGGDEKAKAALEKAQANEKRRMSGAKAFK